MKSWKIGWQISRSKENLPAFICFIIRELRRNWKIWRFFFSYLKRMGCSSLRCTNQAA